MRERRDGDAVHLDHLDDLGTWHEIEAADGAQARIVHENPHVQADRALGDALRGAGLRQVRGYDTRLDPVLPPELVGQRAQAIRAAGDQRHVESRGRETSCECHADAGRRPRDHAPGPVGREHLHLGFLLLAGLACAGYHGKPLRAEIILDVPHVSGLRAARGDAFVLLGTSCRSTIHLVIGALVLAAVATDSMAASGEIPLTRDGGVYQVLATINGWLVRPFVVDSGAADVQVSAVPTEGQRAGRRAGQLAGRPEGRIPSLSGLSSLTIFDSPALPRHPARTAHLKAFVSAQDVLYVGGGSTANLLSLWRAHGLDRLLAKAWRSGAVLAGISAGMLCWFQSGLTDSFGGFKPLRDGLGLLRGAACPRYDGEPLRQAAFRRMIARDGTTGYAADDGAGLHFVGNRLHEVVSSRPTARAYRVAVKRGKVVETQLPTRLLMKLRRAGGA